MTREALEKLNEKQMKFCLTLCELINRYKEKGVTYSAEYTAKLRGYLDCLADMEVISLNEQRALFLWFISDSPLKEKCKGGVTNGS